MLTNRFLLSLVAALFFSTLASADSTNVTAECLHSGASAIASANDRINTYAGQFSTNARQTTPTVLVAYGSPISTFESGSSRFSQPLSGTVIHILGQGILNYKAGLAAPLSGMRPTRFGTEDGTGTGQRHAISTPEPGSLMLLSTGLMGIAGMLRRKLRLG